MSGYVPKLPLKLSSQQGYHMIEDLKGLAKQNFLMLLLTNPGERIMDSNFGIGLKRMLFENFNSNSISDFEDRLRSQVSRYAPYLDIIEVDYENTSEDRNILSVKIRIFIIPLGTSENIIIQSNGELIIT